MTNGNDDDSFDLLGGKNFQSIGGTTLDCIIWSLVDTHESATSGFGFDHIRV